MDFQRIFGVNKARFIGRKNPEILIKNKKKASNKKRKAFWS
jgi:hypothetical protein